MQPGICLVSAAPSAFSARGAGASGTGGLPAYQREDSAPLVALNPVRSGAAIYRRRRNPSAGEWGCSSPPGKISWKT